MKHGIAQFCTEDMAKSMRFLPYEMAPGHLIDLRDLDDAVKRMKAATYRITPQQPSKQLELFV